MPFLALRLDIVNGFSQLIRVLMKFMLPRRRIERGVSARQNLGVSVVNKMMRDKRLEPTYGLPVRLSLAAVAILLKNRREKPSQRKEPMRGPIAFGSENG